MYIFSQISPHNSYINIVPLNISSQTNKIKKLDHIKIIKNSFYKLMIHLSFNHQLTIIYVFPLKSLNFSKLLKFMSEYDESFL